jgi:hypothetical protein
LHKRLVGMSDELKKVLGGEIYQGYRPGATASPPSSAEPENKAPPIELGQSMYEYYRDRQRQLPPNSPD